MYRGKPMWIMLTILGLVLAGCQAVQPASAAELAQGCGLNADALHRMLRLLSAHGVFALERNTFVHTPASRLLRSDHPQTLRSFARMTGMPIAWNGFTDLPQAARTGKPALDWQGFIEYFAEHPEESGLFNQAMAEKSSNVIPAVIDAYDFTTFEVIADSGAVSLAALVDPLGADVAANDTLGS